MAERLSLLLALAISATAARGNDCAPIPAAIFDIEIKTNPLSRFTGAFLLPEEFGGATLDHVLVNYRNQLEQDLSFRLQVYEDREDHKLRHSAFYLPTNYASLEIVAYYRSATCTRSLTAAFVGLTRVK